MIIFYAKIKALEASETTRGSSGRALPGPVGGLQRPPKPPSWLCSGAAHLRLWHVNDYTPYFSAALLDRYALSYNRNTHERVALIHFYLQPPLCYMVPLMLIILAVWGENC